MILIGGAVGEDRGERGQGGEQLKIEVCWSRDWGKQGGLKGNVGRGDREGGAG